MTTEEIRVYYKNLHDTLSASYYAGTSELTKEEFDIQHGKIWRDMGTELKTASDYIEPPIPRDLFTEIDEIKADIVKLKAEPK